MTFGTYLRPILGSEQLLMIPKVTDTRPIAERGDIFGWIDPDFRKWKLALEQVSTEAIICQGLEQFKSGKFKSIYTIPSRPFESLCFSQAQIALFAGIHKDWLRTRGGGMFFLFKEKIDGQEKFFVSYVRFSSRKLLTIKVYPMSEESIWDITTYSCDFVIPQLPFESL